MALEDLKFIAHEKTCEDHFAPTCPQEDLVTCIGVEFIIEKTYLLRIAGSLFPMLLNFINVT